MNENLYKTIEGCTILRTVVGSQLYGTSIGEVSDRDEKGVCIEPLELFAGFSPFEQFEYRTAGDNQARSGPGDLDLVIYSLRKFLKLALNGNPSVIELLFAPGVSHSLGRQLQELAPYLISTKVGKAYLGYMEAQRQRLLGQRGQKDVNRPELVEKHGYDTKYAMHMIRLGMQGVEILTTGSVALPMTDANREFLIRIRNGAYELSSITSMGVNLENTVKALIDTSVLPIQPNYEFVEDWMISHYWEMWKVQRFIIDRTPEIRIQ